MFNRIQTHYISPIDKFLMEFDQTHPLSESQRAEREKYFLINQKRDHEQFEFPTENKSTKIWEDF